MSIVKKLAITLTAMSILLINGLPPAANAFEYDEEITCSTDDFHYTILKNSRNQLILQATPNLSPNDTIVFGNGRVVRNGNRTDRVFTKNGFKYNIRTLYRRKGHATTQVITERGGQPLDRKPCH